MPGSRLIYLAGLPLVHAVFGPIPRTLAGLVLGVAIAVDGYALF